jgi:hypothetical protein
MRSRVRRTVGALVIVAAGALSVVPAARSVETKSWRLAGRDGFLAATLESVSVSTEGIARLAPALEVVEGLDAAYVWSLLAARDGRLYAGTGTSSDLFVVSGRSATLIDDGVALQIESLAEGPDGTIYAGLAPDATIRAVGRDGAARTFADLPVHHVWGLAVDGSGRLLAATGEPARLYAIDRSGEVELLFEAEGDHMTALAVRGARVFFGVDRGGLVYEWLGDGRARVLFDAPEVEVRALVPTADGSLYAAINRDIAESLGGGSGGAGGGSGSGAGGGPGGGSSPGPVVYRIRADGAVESIWTAPDATIQALVDAGDGTLLAGTGGTKGGLYRLRPDTREASLLARPGPPQVLALAVQGDRLALATGSPGKVYRASLAGSPVGRILSPVHDARQVSDWGVLSWDVPAPASGRVSFRTRSGNTGTPDATWSDWSAPLEEPAGSAIPSPAARFLQWEATLADGAALRSVTTAWVEKNLPPLVSRVTITEQGTPLQRGGDAGGPQPVVQQLPGNVRAEFSIGTQASRQGADDEETVWARRYRILRWEASDPNDDHLTFRLESRRAGDGDWSTLEEEVDDPLYVLDSSRLPDGNYDLRVTASDAKANPPGEARTHARESDRLVIDNTAPEVLDLVVRPVGADSVEIAARLVDNLGPLKSADVTVDGKEWMRTLPLDRVWDEAAEELRVRVALPKTGPVEIQVRLFDRAGNRGFARGSRP